MKVLGRGTALLFHFVLHLSCKMLVFVLQVLHQRGIRFLWLESKFKAWCSPTHVNLQVVGLPLGSQGGSTMVVAWGPFEHKVAVPEAE